MKEAPPIIVFLAAQEKAVEKKIEVKT